MNVVIHLGAAACIVVSLYCQVKASGRHYLIEHIGEDETWRVARNGTPTFAGKLISQGYRSGYLVVVCIQTDDTAIHRIAIWRDQVTPSEFSYLQHQLLFNTSPPARRSLKTYFKVWQNA